MNNTANNNNSFKISTTSLLGVVFITLKLTGHISWPWIWVLCPFWIPLALVLIFLLIYLLILGAFALVSSVVNTKLN